MTEVITSPVTGRCAIVTGANKGIGFETCRQLAAKGITVVLTARDEKRAREALEKLRGEGLSDLVVFHQLEVTDPVSVASLVDFTKTTFGKLDILINNAGITGVTLEGDVIAFKKSVVELGNQVGLFDDRSEQEESQAKAKRATIETYELGEQCLQTNYYGAKRMTEAFIPLLQLSDSPRIVNVSSAMGLLEVLSNEWARGVLSDVESLTEERIDEVVNEFLKDLKEDSLQAKDWPQSFSAYGLSKVAMNAYTRIIAKKYPTICVNAVCPGYVKTEGNYYTGILSVEEGAQSPVNLAVLPDGGPSGLFFLRQKVSSF